MNFSDHQHSLVIRGVFSPPLARGSQPIVHDLEKKGKKMFGTDVDQRRAIPGDPNDLRHRQEMQKKNRRGSASLFKSEGFRKCPERGAGQRGSTQLCLGTSRNCTRPRACVCLATGLWVQWVAAAREMRTERLSRSKDQSPFWTSNARWAGLIPLGNTSGAVTTRQLSPAADLSLWCDAERSIEHSGIAVGSRNATVFMECLARVISPSSCCIRYSTSIVSRRIFGVAIKNALV